MSHQYDRADKSMQTLLKEYLRLKHPGPWSDDVVGDEESFPLKKEILNRIRSGSSSLSPILELLSSRDERDHADAADLLGCLKSREAIESLIALLWRDRSMTVRGTIALALERIGAPEALTVAKEYSVMIRSYPEITGKVSDFAAQKEIVGIDIFDINLWKLTSGIQIADDVETGYAKALNFDLSDILAVIGQIGRESEWCCRGVECTGEYASEMHAISDQGLIVSGRTLAHTALMITQTIDGQFMAIREKMNPWLMVEAIDSSWFEVWSSDAAILGQIKGRFSDVEGIHL